MRNVAMKALSILERPPADLFFDNHGAEEDQDLFLAKYKTKELSVFDLNDGGERLGQPIRCVFEEHSNLPKWQSGKNRMLKPEILPAADKEVGFGQEVGSPQLPLFAK